MDYMVYQGSSAINAVAALNPTTLAAAERKGIVIMNTNGHVFRSFGKLKFTIHVSVLSYRSKIRHFDNRSYQ